MCCLGMCRLFESVLLLYIESWLTSVDYSCSLSFCWKFNHIMFSWFSSAFNHILWDILAVIYPLCSSLTMMNWWILWWILLTLWIMELDQKLFIIVGLVLPCLDFFEQSTNGGSIKLASGVQWTTVDLLKCNYYFFNNLSECVITHLSVGWSTQNTFYCFAALQGL